MNQQSLANSYQHANASVPFDIEETDGDIVYYTTPRRPSSSWWNRRISRFVLAFVAAYVVIGTGNNFLYLADDDHQTPSSDNRGTYFLHMLGRRHKTDEERSSHDVADKYSMHLTNRDGYGDSHYNNKQTSSKHRNRGSEKDRDNFIDIDSTDDRSNKDKDNSDVFHYHHHRAYKTVADKAHERGIKQTLRRKHRKSITHDDDEYSDDHYDSKSNSRDTPISKDDDFVTPGAVDDRSYFDDYVNDTKQQNDTTVAEVVTPSPPDGKLDQTQPEQVVVVDESPIAQQSTDSVDVVAVVDNKTDTAATNTPTEKSDVIPQLVIYYDTNTGDNSAQHQPQQHHVDIPNRNCLHIICIDFLPNWMRFNKREGWISVKFPFH